MKSSIFQFGLIIGIITLFAFNTVSEKTNISDPIIGTWKSIRTVYIFSDNSTEVSLTDSCFGRSRWTYSENGTLNFKRFDQKNKNKSCTERPSDFWTGTWEKSNNDVYKTNHNVKYSEENIVSQNNSTDTYIFSNNGNELKVTTDYKKTNTLIDDKYKSHYTIFKRVTE